MSPWSSYGDEDSGRGRLGSGEGARRIVSAGLESENLRGLENHYSQFNEQQTIFFSRQLLVVFDDLPG